MESDRVNPKHLPFLSYIHINWGPAFLEWLSSYTGNINFSLHSDHSSLHLRFLLNKEGIGFLLESIAEQYIKEKLLRELTIESDVPIPSNSVYIIFQKRKKKIVEPILEILNAR